MSQFDTSWPLQIQKSNIFSKTKNYIEKFIEEIYDRDFDVFVTAICVVFKYHDDEIKNFRYFSFEETSSRGCHLHHTVENISVSFFLFSIGSLNNVMGNSDNIGEKRSQFFWKFWLGNEISQILERAAVKLEGLWILDLIT